MKRVLRALGFVASVGLAATVMVGPPGAAYASSGSTVNVTVKWVCDNKPLFTDAALTVPAGIVPLNGQHFYLEGLTSTTVELTPITVPASTAVYYGERDCFAFIIHIGGF